MKKNIPTVTPNLFSDDENRKFKTKTNLLITFSKNIVCCKHTYNIRISERGNMMPNTKNIVHFGNFYYTSYI